MITDASVKLKGKSMRNFRCEYKLNELISDFRCFFRFGCIYETQNGKLMADLEVVDNDYDNDEGRSIFTLTCLDDNEDYDYTSNGKACFDDGEAYTLSKHRGDLPLMLYRVHPKASGKPSPYFISLHAAIQFIQDKKLDPLQCNIHLSMRGFKMGMPEIIVHHMRDIVYLNLINDVVLNTNTTTYKLPPEPEIVDGEGCGKALLGW